MEISRYLAMTRGEMAHFSCPSGYFPGWMACHFSSYGTGLSNFPLRLSPGSMLIVNDRTPICGHDPQLILQQLADMADTFRCSGILLDFQRPAVAETAQLCDILADRLPCPVGISEVYARSTKGPVFLPPIPANVLPESYLAPWGKREIWLEIAPSPLEITVTEAGSRESPLPVPPDAPNAFYDEGLFCHYYTEVLENAARFTIWRSWESMDAMANTLAALGVAKTIGLFQQWHTMAVPENARKKAPCCETGRF